jgi:uncharacterized protein
MPASGQSPLAGAPWAHLRESHSAVVFLVGDRAYKLKKPVSLGFLDYSTREARLAACHRELELNRRIAPDVYLGVIDLLDPAGRPCDHLVAMRRMPDDRRLARLVADGGLEDQELRRIARVLAGFHAGAQRSPQIDVEGGRDALRGRWLANFRQARGFRELLGAEQVRQVERLALRFLAGRAPLFELRVGQRRIVDGHGDLLADDIFCLPDGPRLLDCLEFDDRLRYVDQVDDAAFLAMDLERLGDAHAAERFLRWYQEFSGDPAPPSLVHHYIAYRAFVRAKVSCLRQLQAGGSARQVHQRQARQLVRLCVRHLRAGRVRLVLVGGLPGSGKSTLAGAIADRSGMVWVSSDRVRRELAGLPPDRTAVAAFRHGLYRPERTREVYTELLDRARAGLVRGESMLLDATWVDAEYRQAARDLAERRHADLIELHCHAPAPVLAARLQGRASPAGQPDPAGLSGPSVSDAGPEVAAALAAVQDPWPTAIRIDTGRDFDASLRECLEHAAG